MAVSAQAFSNSTIPAVRVPRWWRWLSLRFFAASERAKFYSRLARILRRPNANVTSVIEDLYERAYKRSKIDSTTVVLSEVLTALRSGHSISSAFAIFATPIEIMLIKGGEQAGSTGEVTAESRRTGLQRALEHIMKLNAGTKATRRAVHAAYANLGLYVAMIIVSLLTLSDYVVPKIGAAFPPQHWQGVAGSLYVASKIVNTVGFSVVIALILAVGFATPFTFPYWRGRVRNFLDRFPPFSFYRLQEGGGWLMSIPSLTEGGTMKAHDALIATAAIAKPWLRDHIRSIALMMERGFQFGNAMERAGGFPDKEITADVRLYEKQGLDIDTVLKEISAEWTETGTEMIKYQAKILEQVSMVLFAVVLVWFTLGTVVLQVQMPAYFMSGAGM